MKCKIAAITIILLFLFCSPVFLLDKNRSYPKFDTINTADGPVKVYNIQTAGSHMYLVECKGGLFVIDAGWPGYESKVLRIMKTIGRNDLKMIIITHGHFDHYASAAALRRLTGAKVAIYKDDADAMARGKTPLKKIRSWGWIGWVFLPLGEHAMRVKPVKADILFNDGDRLDKYGIKGYILHTPGHTPGSCSIIIEDSIAFVGDLITMTSHPCSQFIYAFDWYQIAKSIDKIKKIGPVYTYSGHGDRYIKKDEVLNLKPYLPSK